MVNESKRRMFSTPLARYRLGSLLVWLGVLTWVPFIFLRIAGEKPSIFFYLPIHLLGVIGGARMRSLARGEAGTPGVRNIWDVLGHLMIWAGVAVWVPYLYLKLVMGTSVEAMDYLPFHLTGILSGILLLLIGKLISKRDQANS